MPSPSIDAVRDLARTVQVFAIIGLVTLVVVIGVNHLYPAVLALLRGDTLADRLNGAGLHLISALPLMFFADAADKLRRAFDDYVAGRFFEARAARLVSESGLDVAWALGASALIVPTLLLWVGARGGGGIDAQIEPETIALFSFALFIVAVGRILQQAADLKADNDAIV